MSCTKPAFAVIGKEGSTSDGEGFIARLWNDANAHFTEIAGLAARDENGDLIGIWGAMSDMSRSFMPWQDRFSKGLYLAGIECMLDARAPDGWTKWVIPAHEYLYVECGDGDTFHEMLDYLTENGYTLAGSVHDYTCPKTGKRYMFFPVG